VWQLMGCVVSCGWKAFNYARCLRPMSKLIETANKATNMDEIDFALDELCVWVLQSECGECGAWRVLHELLAGGAALEFVTTGGLTLVTEVLTSERFERDELVFRTCLRLLIQASAHGESCTSSVSSHVTTAPSAAVTSRPLTTMFDVVEKTVADRWSTHEDILFQAERFRNNVQGHLARVAERVIALPHVKAEDALSAVHDNIKTQRVVLAAMSILAERAWRFQEPPVGELAVLSEVVDNYGFDRQVMRVTTAVIYDLAASSFFDGRSLLGGTTAIISKLSELLQTLVSANAHGDLVQLVLYAQGELLRDHEENQLRFLRSGTKGGHIAIRRVEERIQAMAYDRPILIPRAVREVCTDPFGVVKRAAELRDRLRAEAEFEELHYGEKRRKMEFSDIRDKVAFRTGGFLLPKCERHAQIDAELSETSAFLQTIGTE
jgi:hypothetical protein